MVAAKNTTPSFIRSTNAYNTLVQTLKNWNLEALAPTVLRLLQEGHDQTIIPIMLQDTDAYKQRFAGNEIRRKAGLAVLNPAEYLSTEAAYRQIMESNGLPSGFYDQPDDFSKWIGNDVAPTEIQTRVGYAVDAAQRVDAGTKKAFKEFYGVTSDHLAAFFLDQDRALPQIHKQARAARIGSEGYDQGIGLLSRNEAERLATSDLVGDTEISSAMAGVAENSKGVGFLGDLYNQDYSTKDAANEVFFGDVAAKRKRQDLIGRERATFAGNTGVGKTSLEQKGNY